VGTTKIEGPLILTNLPNAQATDTTLLFVNANGKVKAAGPSALMGIMYPNPAEIDPCPFGVFNNRPIWFSKPNILWTGNPCPENKKEIEVSKLEKGMYEVALCGKDKLYKQKIIIH
jgi:hypothetical protein